MTAKDIPHPDAERRRERGTTIILVDAQPIVRDGLEDRATQAGFDVVAQASTRGTAEDLIARHRPDLAIIDIDVVLDLEDGLELVGWIHAHYRATRVVVFSLRDPTIYGERALRAGAFGYVGKLEPVADLIEALHSVAAGRMHTPRALADRLAQGVHGRARNQGSGLLDVLTDRELQIFEILGSGRSTQQIADALGVSMKTIATHRAHIQRKLGIPSLGELVRRAVLWVEEQRPHERYEDRPLERLERSGA